MGLHRSTATRHRVIQTAAGCVVIAFGIGGVLNAGLGAGPYTLLVDGLANATRLSVGTTVVVAGCALTVIAWLLGRPPTVGHSLTIGLVALVVNVATEMVPTTDVILPGFVLFTAGTAAIGAGVGIYRAAAWTEGPLDSLPQALIDRGLAARPVFITSQIVFAMVGTILGGDAGIGTVVAAFTIGPIALAVERGCAETSPWNRLRA